MRYLIPLRHGKGAASLVAVLVAILLILFVIPLLSFREQPLLPSLSFRLLLSAVLLLGWSIYYLMRYSLFFSAEEQQLQQLREERIQQREQKNRRRNLKRWLKHLQGRRSSFLRPANPGCWYLTLTTDSELAKSVIPQLWPVVQTDPADVRDIEAYTGSDQLVLAKTIGDAGEGRLHDSLELLVSQARRLRAGVPFQGVVLLLRHDDLDDVSLLQKVSHRLRMLAAEIKGTLPVYLVIPDLESVTGFNEFAWSLGTSDQQQLFGVSLGNSGASVRTSLLTDNLKELQKSLDAQLARALYQERNLHRRKELMQFPARLEAFCNKLADQLNYFLPGVPELVLRSVHFAGRSEPVQTQAISTDLVTEPKTQKSRWYFVQGWWKQMIVPDRNLARPNSTWQRQLWAGHALKASAVVIAGIVIAVLQFKTYLHSERSLSLLQELNYQGASSAGKPETNAASVLERIQAWIGIMNDASASGPWLGWPGLAVSGSVDQAVQDFRHKLHRETILQMLGRQAEEVARDPESTPESLLAALRVYLMMAEPERRDPEFISGWFVGQMQARWPSRTFQPEPVQERVLEALSLEPEPLPVDQELIAEVRARLNQIPYEQQLYLRVKQIARYQGPGEFSFMSGLGYEMTEAFEGGSFTVPGLFSMKGYLQVFRPELDRLLEEYEDERWVLGAESANPSGQDLKRIRSAVERAYADEYVRYWQTALNELRVVQARNLEHMLSVLALLSGPASPFKLVLEASSEQTDFSLENLTRGISEQLATVSSLGGSAGRVANKANKLGQALSPELEATDRGPASLVVIRDHFSDIHRMVRAGEGQKPVVESLQALLMELQQYLAPLALGGQADAIYQASIRRFQSGGTDIIGRTRLAARQYPEPLRSWTLDLTDQIWSMMLQDVQQQVQIAYAADLRSYYERHLDRRYPLFRNGNQEVGFEHFTEFFRPQGIEQTFFQTHIQPFVESGRSVWTPRKVDGRGLAISSRVLQQFQRAQRIRDGLFGGNQEFRVKMQLRPVFLDANVSRFELRLDDKRLSYRHGPQRMLPIEWPVSSVSPGLGVSFEDYNGLIAKRSFDGIWSLTRMLDQFELESGSEGGPWQVGYELDGRRVVYSLQGGSDLQVLVRQELQRYRMPSSLGE